MQRPLLLLIGAALTLSAQSQQITNVTWSPNPLHSCEQVTFNVSGTGSFSLNYLNINTAGGVLELTIQGSGSGSGSFNIPIGPIGPYPAEEDRPLVVNLEQNGNVINTWSGTITITETELPDVGEFTTIDVCSSDAPFPLISRLEGTPDDGGTWTDPNGQTVGNGMFVPGTSPEGIYYYTFEFPEPCGTLMQMLIIGYTANNSPGADTTVVLCPMAGLPEVDLFGMLGGSPDAGGTWSGGNTTGIFVPGTSAPGAYTYHVDGIAPCLGSQATVTVQAGEFSNAGVGDSAIFCFDETSADLGEYVTGGNQDGIWYGPSGFGIGFYGELFDVSQEGEGLYYLVSTTEPCPADTAFVVVTLDGPPCTLGLADMDPTADAVRLIPNPAHQLVNLVMDHAMEVHAIVLSDLSGRTMARFPVEARPGTLHRTINVSAYPAGYYLLTLEGPQGRICKQLLVE